MKQKNSISKNKSVLSIFGLALLLLLSPCKVRNYIEAELGIPQTEVTNKGKILVTNASCISIDSIKTTTTSSKIVWQIAPTLPLNKVNYTFLNTIDFTPKSINSYASKKASILFVPFYILHQNFKVYS